MSVKGNPLVMLIEESIHLRNSAQEIFSKALGGPNLSRLEGLILLSIIEAGQPLTAPQVGRNLGHTRQVVQRAANRLVDLGLLQKLPNPDHKTAALFDATPEGRARQADTGEAMIALVNEVLTDSDMKACERMCRDIRRIRARIESLAPSFSE